MELVLLLDYHHLHSPHLPYTPHQWGGSMVSVSTDLLIYINGYRYVVGMYNLYSELSGGK